MSERSAVMAIVALLAFGMAGCQNSSANRKDPSGSGGDVEAKPSVVELHHHVATAAAGQEAQPPVATVGREAPGFELPAYHRGQFTTVKLADYRGKWVLLCFYPGDFTFV